jgi:hypothetical protein
MYVNYTIAGVDYQSGPYSAADIAWQEKDIKSYEGVSQCFIVAKKDEKRKFVEQSA